MPIQVWFLIHDPWFRQPPKPVGDGPDYENIAFHLARGEGWSLDWTNPEWQAPYIAASVSHFELPSGAAVDNQSVDSHSQGLQPIADYSVQLARRDGLAPTTGRPPLLPTLIAAIYWIFDRGPTGFACVRLALACSLAIASAVAVAMSARLVAVLTPQQWPVVLAAFTTMSLAALDRTARTYATDFLTEPLALLITQLWIWCVCELTGVFPRTRSESASRQRRRTRMLVILAGVLLAMLVATRSVVVLWLPGVWFIISLAGKVSTTRLQHSADQPPTSQPKRLSSFWLACTMLAVAMLVCAPWWARNCLVLGTFMPLGTQGSISLLGGYNDESLRQGGAWQLAPELRLRERVEGAMAIDNSAAIPHREVHVAGEASRAVWSWIRLRRNVLPGLAWQRIKTEWNPYTGRALAWKIAALLGLGWLTWLYPRAAILLGGVLIVNTLTVMLLYSVGGRFLVPLYGVLYTLAGIGIACTCQRIGRFFSLLKT